MAVSEAPSPWWAPDVSQMCSAVGNTSGLRQEYTTTTTTTATATIWSPNQMYLPLSWRWRGPNMVKLNLLILEWAQSISHYLSSHILYIHCNESQRSEFFRVSQFCSAWQGVHFPLNCKNAVDHKRLTTPEAFLTRFFKNCICMRANSVNISQHIYSCEWNVCLVTSTNSERSENS